MPSISYQEHVKISIEIIILDDKESLETITQGLNEGRFTKSITDSLIYNEKSDPIAQIIDIEEGDIETDIFCAEKQNR